MLRVCIAKTHYTLVLWVALHSLIWSHRCNSTIIRHWRRKSEIESKFHSHPCEIICPRSSAWLFRFCAKSRSWQSWSIHDNDVITDPVASTTDSASGIDFPSLEWNIQTPTNCELRATQHFPSYLVPSDSCCSSVIGSRDWRKKKMIFLIRVAAIKLLPEQ